MRSDFFDGGFGERRFGISDLLFRSLPRARTTSRRPSPRLITLVNDETLRPRRKYLKGRQELNHRALFQIGQAFECPALLQCLTGMRQNGVAQRCEQTVVE